jgi:hypothetical protein
MTRKALGGWASEGEALISAAKPRIAADAMVTGWRIRYGTTRIRLSWIIGGVLWRATE